MWIKTVVGVVAVAAVLVAGALAFGSFRWTRATGGVIARLRSSALAAPVSHYDPHELERLPPPVARYLAAALTAGQPLVGTADIRWRGQFRTADSEDSWRPFVATQTFNAIPPGFVWDARIRMAPGVRVYVRDAYVGGAGAMRGEILGLFPVMDIHGAAEIAAGALQRYLAEAVWFPTRLLPSQGVDWTPVDDSTAVAALTSEGLRVALEFRFDAAGDVVGVFTPARYREVHGAFEPTPWAGRFKAHAERDGMRIPSEAEVEWQLAGRRLPYWRGRLVDVRYRSVP